MNQTFEYRVAPDAEFAVIGDPVSHSLSPRMHAAAFAALGLPYRYVAIHVAPGEVGRALDALASKGYRGVNATVPHKREALECCDFKEPFAVRVEAANTVDLTRRSCINTDAPGFMETLAPLELRSKTALVLGAGGSARALVAALSDDGWAVRIHNRTRTKAELLAQEFGASVTEDPDPAETDLIVNTTSASLHGAEIEIEWSRAGDGAIAYELMYSPAPTPFLASAAAHGLQTVDGLPLLVAQGALALEYWLGVPAPRQAMLEALRE